MSELSFLKAFEVRDDLERYGDNALLLYALELTGRLIDN